MGKLYAISDIHGCYETFHGLVFDKICLQKSDRLILLGDYIDRGDKSREVIDLILDLDEKGYDITPLMGNHEAMMLDSHRDTSMLPLWLYNSGSDTLLSFGISDLSDLETRYLDFLMNLRYYEKVGDIIFVHAGFNDELQDPFTDNYTMIWETRSGYNNPAFKGKTIIHGHRPKTIDYVKSLIEAKSSVIPIDTGCVYSKESGLGFLSALDVSSMKLVTLSNY